MKKESKMRIYTKTFMANADGVVIATKANNLPDKVIINDNAAIIWYGDNKTVCKRAEDEEPDAVKAFLWAYYIATSGTSRSKAKRFLYEQMPKEEDNDAAATVAEIMEKIAQALRQGQGKEKEQK